MIKIENTMRTVSFLLNKQTNKHNKMRIVLMVQKE